MKLKSFTFAAAVAAGCLGALPMPGAHAQTATEQFFPALVYRTGPYGPNGVPFANGYIDYMALINAKGGINGVRVSWEECETGYATDRGVECYERLKGKNGGASLFHPLATGITFALTEKAPTDRIPILTAGYGRSDTADGMAFKWNFPIAGTYWDAGDVLIQHLAKKEGGFDKLKGKKIALVYHDSPYGKEPIAVLQQRQKMHGFELSLLPVTHPGVEQRATWLQVRQLRPDYVLLWGWGVMNATALREAASTGYPRDKMYGSWWAGAEQDVKDVGELAKGYNALAFQHGAERESAVVRDVLQQVYDKGQGAGPRDDVGSVLYMRGIIAAMLSVEGVRRAQERFGTGKVMTSEQVRWGLENLDLDQKKLEALGFAGVMRPIKTTCADHRGPAWLRIHTWDGKQWQFSSDWYQSDDSIIQPMVRASADQYLAEKGLKRRSPEDCQN